MFIDPPGCLPVLPNQLWTYGMLPIRKTTTISLYIKSNIFELPYCPEIKVLRFILSAEESLRGIVKEEVSPRNFFSKSLSFALCNISSGCCHLAATVWEMQS